MQSTEIFEEDPPKSADNSEDTADSLIISLDGYEGPIDLLLTMARDQKVDLRQISILALAEQYLGFVERARKMRIELAADYLVMAAWLAYLKSKLLLPVAPSDSAEDELSGEALAEALAFQLQRLEAMQNAAQQLFSLPRLGAGRFTGGLHHRAQGPNTKITYRSSLYELLDAYANITRRQNPPQYDIKTWTLVSMDEATERLANMIGRLPEREWNDLWRALDNFTPINDDDEAPLHSKSALASMLTAALEMVKQERIDLQQEGLFAPIYIRARTQTPPEAANDQ